MADIVEAVFFDLDDTLVHDGAGAAVRQAAAGLARVLPFTLEQILAANTDAWSGCWAEQGERWMRGELPGDGLPRDIWRRTLSALGQDDPTLLDTAVELHLSAEPGAFRLYDETLGVLEALRADGIPIGVITNGPSDIQRRKLATVGIDSLFDVIVASGDIGILKPEPEIFRSALDRIGADPARAVHVGDNFAADVVGASDAGMFAVWVNRAGSVAPDLGIPHHPAQSLVEVLAIAAPGRARRAG